MRGFFYFKIILYFYYNYNNIYIKFATMDSNTLKNIVTGYTNLLKDKVNILPEDIKNLSNARMEICRSCPSNKFNEIDERCKICKCYMPAATKAIGKVCPDNHW